MTLLTTLEYFDLLNGGRVQDAANLQQLQGVSTSIGDGSLDHRVANLLDLDIERLSTLAHGGSASQRGQQSDVAKELHFGLVVAADLLRRNKAGLRMISRVISIGSSIAEGRIVFISL